MEAINLIFGYLFTQPLPLPIQPNSRQRKLAGKREYKKISDKQFKITINFVHGALKFNKWKTFFSHPRVLKIVPYFFRSYCNGNGFFY